MTRLIRAESHADSADQELPAARALADDLEAAGIPCEWDEVLPGRFNLTARIPGCGTGPSLLFNGHLDTVPKYGMNLAFEPFVRDGKIYGRGSVDMKGALAVMAGVLKAFRRAGIPLGGDILLAATVGEESYSPGAFRLAAQGRPADYAIVGEPTELRIGIAHKGVAWYEAAFEGKSVHGSVPESGVNAVYHASRWIELLQRSYIPELKRRSHPLLGSPTINVGMIEGGTRPVIVPGSCTVRFERRLLPGESADSALAELRGTLAEAGEGVAGWNARAEQMDNFHGVPHEALDTSPDSGIVRALADAAGQIGLQAEPVGLPFWTDGALIRSTGTEAVVCGPGRIEQAHSDEEYVEREQLEQAFRLYALAVLRLNGVS
nr:M20 family metallopeptidase [Cohnella zeiphila]